jgi:hypothetical protein
VRARSLKPRRDLVPAKSEIEKPVHEHERGLDAGGRFPFEDVTREPRRERDAA